MHARQYTEDVGGKRMWEGERLARLARGKNKKQEVKKRKRKR